MIDVRRSSPGRAVRKLVQMPRRPDADSDPQPAGDTPARDVGAGNRRRARRRAADGLTSSEAARAGALRDPRTTRCDYARRRQSPLHPGVPNSGQLHHWPCAARRRPGCGGGVSSRSYFAAVASEWDSLRSDFFSERVREAALEALDVKSGSRAADVGAGTGFMTEALLDRGLTVVAVDESPEMLSVLRRKLGDAVDCRVCDGQS